MRISDWSSDVCSSDLQRHVIRHMLEFGHRLGQHGGLDLLALAVVAVELGRHDIRLAGIVAGQQPCAEIGLADAAAGIDPRPEQEAEMIGTGGFAERSEEHTSELPSIMRT